MERINIKNYRIPEQTNIKVLPSWQEYALQVCKDFNLIGQYKGMIFRYCKKNTEYVKGKVENTKEKFGTERLESKGRYLISLFRTKKPWEK